MATSTKSSTTTKASPATKQKASTKSRAVLRLVQPGSWVTCCACAEQVKYQVRAQNQQVICNVYDDGVWNRVEHFHADCYEAAENPFGEASDD